MAFLNITGFRDCPLEDLPMLGVSENGNESEGVRVVDVAKGAGRLQVYVFVVVVGLTEMGLGGSLL